MRFTMKEILVAVAISALGLAIAPAGGDYWGILTPLSALVSRFAPLALVVPALLVLSFSALAEILLAIPVPLWVYVPVAIALVGAVRPRNGGQPAPRRIALLVVALILIACLYLVPWTTRKPFLRRLYSIRPGMTEPEVRRKMAGYIEGSGMKDPGTGREFAISRSLVFRHSHAPQFNADWGIVTFANGKVVDVEFSPD